MYFASGGLPLPAAATSTRNINDDMMTRVTDNDVA
jgi:hypothetical protein